MAKIKLMLLLLATGPWTLASMAEAACNTDITSTRPDGRYSDNGDGTITDRVTGLMWKQCPEGLSTTTTACDTTSSTTYTWQDALQQVEMLNNSGGYAGYSDWRLPNRNELASLVERQCYSPAINTTLFPNTGTMGFAYWSSSPVSPNLGHAWYVHFENGSIKYTVKTSLFRVRLVRGGQ